MAIFNGVDGSVFASQPAFAQLVSNILIARNITPNLMLY
jgi:hypothetical protein